MPSDFHRSPKFLKGTLVACDSKIQEIDVDLFQANEIANICEIFKTTIRGQ